MESIATVIGINPHQNPVIPFGFPNALRRFYSSLHSDQKDESRQDTQASPSWSNAEDLQFVPLAQFAVCKF